LPVRHSRSLRELSTADADRPDSLVSALHGAQTVLLVSGTEFGRRVTQHAAVEAKEAIARFLK
jgi:uncharacterized protein YbjT (DUF2867 family)